MESWKITSIVTILILGSVGLSQNVLADVTVSVPQGTSVPGCEKTNECYDPFEVTIGAGSKVTWSNDDTAAHTVTSGTPNEGPFGKFDSSIFSSGTTFSQTFEKPGVYPYFCMVHPWMTGVVTVIDVPASTEKNETDAPKKSTDLERYSPLAATEDDKKGPHIRSTSSYVDMLGNLHVIGEFINNQNQALTFVKIIGTMFDENGELLDTEFTFTDLGVVPPFGKSSFDIIFGGGASGVETYRVTSEFMEEDAKLPLLHIETVGIRTDQIGSTHLFGSVKNLGVTANFVKVVGIVYDKEGKVIGTGFTFTEPVDLYKSKTGKFDVIISPKVSHTKVATYGLHVESQEYGMIFEIPEGASSEVSSSEKQDSEGGGCLIATATYGSELSPQVQQLRELRDNKLLQTESGSAFMESFNDFYYSFSPIIADYERENPVFREGVKLAITPMISSLSILNYVDMDSEAEVLGYGISLILLNIGMYVGVPVAVVVGIRKF